MKYRPVDVLNLANEVTAAVILMLIESPKTI